MIMQKVKVEENWTKTELKQTRVHNHKEEPESRKENRKIREKTMEMVSEFSVKICLMIIITSLSIYTRDQS